MSKIFKKIAGSKTAVTVKMDSIEVMGQAVGEKDVFCVHWSMKGLRGRESTGETDNARAAVAGGASYTTARFENIFAGEVHPKQRKDGAGYEAMEFEMRVVSPALHKKDEKIIGKALVNIFEKVPVLTAGQPHHSEQTVSLTTTGNAVAHINLTLALKSDAPAEEAEAGEPERATTPTSPSATEPPPLVVKTPPSTPQKESESASTGTTEPAKEETESKSRHRKRRSSNSAAMMSAQLKRKDEEIKAKDEEIKKKDEDLKQKDDELKQKDEELKKKDEELKQKEEELKQKDEELKKKDEEAAQFRKENQPKLEISDAELYELRRSKSYLECRVKELEQANEKTDVVPHDTEQDQMREQLAELQAEKERIEDEKAQISEELKAAKKEIEELKARPAESDDKSKDIEVLNKQLTALKEELAKKNASGSKADAAAPAPAKSGIVMQAIIGAVGAVLGIIIGQILF